MPTTKKGAVNPAPSQCFFDEPSAEILRSKAALAEQRRLWLAASPGEVMADYSLTNTDGTPTTLSTLFGTQSDLLVVHNMGRGCPYCTMWADGLIGLARHLERRAALVLSSPDEPEVLKAFAAERRWPFRCVSIAGSTFARDLGFEPKPGEFHPGVSGFHRSADGTIHRTGASRFGPGDDFCAAWPMFNLLRGGEGTFVPN